MCTYQIPKAGRGELISPERLVIVYWNMAGVGMAKVHGVYQIVDTLNNLLKSQRDIKFYVSERRTSLAELRSKGIIDYARIDDKNNLHVFLVKNMDDLPEADWRRAIANLPKTLEDKLGGKDINTRYSWSKQKYLDSTEMSADIAGQWGDTPNKAPGALRVALDKVDTANVNKLYDLYDAQDPSVHANGARAANFIRYIKSGPTIVLARQLWRNMGWSELAISMGVKVAAPELGSDVIAVLRTEFEKVVKRQGFTVTERTAPLMHKDTLATRVEGKIDPRNPLSKDIGRAYEEVRLGIESSQQYRQMQRNKMDANKNGDAAAVQKIDKDMSDYMSKEISRITSSADFKNKLSALSQDAQYAADVAKGVIDYYRSVVSENISIMDQKLIQIKKHPKYQYYVIVSVAGTLIPTLQ